MNGEIDEIKQLEAMAIEGLRSGRAFEPPPGYWEEKHRRLSERLRNSG